MIHSRIQPTVRSWLPIPSFLSLAVAVVADQTVVFTVDAAPAVEDNLNTTVCSDGTAGIVFATETSPLSVAAASYNMVTITVQAGLVRTAGNPAFPRNGVTANDIQADQFRNPTNDPLIGDLRSTGSFWRTMSWDLLEILFSPWSPKSLLRL
jgi:hypothetical protein